MKIDDEVEASASHIANELQESQNGKWLEPVPQGHSIHDQGVISTTRQFDNFSPWLTDCYRDAGARKSLPNRVQSRQAHYHITELAKINNQYVARIKTHVTSDLRSKPSPQVQAFLLQRARRSRPVISTGCATPSSPMIVGATSSNAPPDRRLSPRESSSIR